MTDIQELQEEIYGSVFKFPQMDNEEKEESQAITLHLQDSNDDQTLTKWLSTLHLDHIYNKLKELGAEEIEDMTLLDEEDFNSLGLKNIQMKKREVLHQPKVNKWRAAQGEYGIKAMGRWIRNI